MPEASSRSEMAGSAGLAGAAGALSAARAGPDDSQDAAATATDTTTRLDRTWSMNGSPCFVGVFEQKALGTTPQCIWHANNEALNSGALRAARSGGHESV